MLGKSLAHLFTSPNIPERPRKLTKSNEDQRKATKIPAHPYTNVEPQFPTRTPLCRWTYIAVAPRILWGRHRVGLDEYRQGIEIKRLTHRGELAEKTKASQKNCVPIHNVLLRGWQGCEKSANHGSWDLGLGSWDSCGHAGPALIVTLPNASPGGTSLSLSEGRGGRRNHALRKLRDVPPSACNVNQLGNYDQGRAGLLSAIPNPFSPTRTLLLSPFPPGGGVGTIRLFGLRPAGSPGPS